jgi:tetratricopeptide (TPR) repeat protein
MPRGLLPLEKKVEAGDSLTAEELLQLEQAAREEGGVRPRLLVAHALINQDSCREALTLLETLEREFPNDAQVPFAKARALAAMERYTDAEPALKRALELQPNDLEAMKALAVLKMRRGERDRARQLAAQVLEQDPLDAEAQALLTEMDETRSAASTGPKEVVLLPEFRRALIERLQRGSTPHLLQKDDLLVRLGKGGVARLDLRSLYRGFLDSEQDLKTSIEAIAVELAERALEPKSRQALLSTVLPLLRDATFLDRAVGAAHREGPGGLFIFYAPFDPQMVRYVPEGSLQALRVSMQELDDSAWINLDERLADPIPMALEPAGLRLAARPSGLWALAKGDGHDAARLLSPLQQRKLSSDVGPPPWRVYLGLRELVLIAREGSEEAAELETLEPAKDGIRGVFRIDEGRLQQLPGAVAWRDV